MTPPIRIEQSTFSRSRRNGYVIDARIAWWSFQTRSEAVVLTVLGELDASNTDLFHKSVGELPEGGEPFVIDLSKVTFVGVQFLQTVARLDAACRNGRTRWALVVNPEMRTLFDRVDRADALPVTSSLPEAIRAVTAGGKTGLPLISPTKR